MSRALACTAAPHTATGGGGSGIPKRPSVGPAEVLPFPIARRVAFLERMADSVASCRDPQKHLDRAAEQQRQAMRRRGLPEEVIESEIATFYQEIIERVS